MIRRKKTRIISPDLNLEFEELYFEIQDKTLIKWKRRDIVLLKENSRKSKLYKV